MCLFFGFHFSSSPIRLSSRTFVYYLKRDFELSQTSPSNFFSPSLLDHLDLAVISLAFSFILFLHHFILYSEKFSVLFFQLTNMIFSLVFSYLKTLFLISKNFFLFSDGSFLIANSSYFMTICVLKFLKKLQRFNFFPFFLHYYFCFCQGQLSSLFVLMFLICNPGIPQILECLWRLDWWYLL